MHMCHLQHSKIIAIQYKPPLFAFVHVKYADLFQITWVNYAEMAGVDCETSVAMLHL